MDNQLFRYSVLSHESSTTKESERVNSVSSSFSHISQNPLCLKYLQSGGYADILLNEFTGTCLKIFHYRGAEEQEFRNVRYLKKLYERNKHNPHYSGRVMKYLNYGYVSKALAFEMLQVVHHNQPEKVNQIMKNFRSDIQIPYVSMEYINGLDGVELGMKIRRMDENIASQLMHSLLLSVQELHSMGMIHRDIKPDNFMIYRNQFGLLEVKLIDLGLALPHGFSNTFGRLDGTRYYAAPEAQSGVQTEASDLFSVGMSFFRLCGSPPNASTPFLKLIMKMTSTDPINRGTVNDAIEALKTIFKSSSMYYVASV